MGVHLREDYKIARTFFLVLSFFSLLCLGHKMEESIVLVFIRNTKFAIERCAIVYYNLI